MDADQRSGDSGAEEEEEAATESLVCTVLSALQHLGEHHDTPPNVSFTHIHSTTLSCLHDRPVILVPCLRLLQGQSRTRRRS